MIWISGVGSDLNPRFLLRVNGKAISRDEEPTQDLELGP